MFTPRDGAPPRPVLSGPPFSVVDVIGDVDGVTVRVSGEVDLLTAPQLATTSRIASKPAPAALGSLST